MILFAEVNDAQNSAARIGGYSQIALMHPSNSGEFFLFLFFDFSDFFSFILFYFILFVQTSV